MELTSMNLNLSGQFRAIPERVHSDSGLPKGVGDVELQVRKLREEVVIEAGGFMIRTDLALETQERIRGRDQGIRGVRVTEEQREGGTRLSTVVIETENAAKQLGRPRGQYLTIENPRMNEEDGEYHREISMELARCIRSLLPQNGEKMPESDLRKEIDYSVLIVGLGNRAVSPDALGPTVVDQLYITRHIIREYGKYAFGTDHFSRVSAIVPGVMGQTGMECVEILKGVVEQTRPELLITVDALAARSIRRLGRTIQLTDTGITPGSGVGNHRNAITEESIGIPVISIGVPTVVDAATIVSDALCGLIEELSEGEEDQLVRRESAEAAHRKLPPQLNSMFVTPKDIDSTIRHLSYLISEGLNMAFLGDWEKRA